MTHLGVANRDSLAHDVARSGCLCTHRSLMLLGLYTLCLFLCADLVFPRDEVIRVFLRLGGI